MSVNYDNTRIIPNHNDPEKHDELVENLCDVDEPVTKEVPLETLQAIGNSLMGKIPTENHYRMLYEGVMDSIFVCRDHQDGHFGPFLEVNDIACKRFGYSREELLATDPACFVGASVALFGTSLRSLQASRPIVFEAEMITKAGMSFPAELHVRRFTFDGQPAVIALVRDITDRRQSEHRLRQSEERYRKLIEASPDAVSIIDANGQVAFISQNTLKMLGAKNASAVLGVSPLRWIAPEHFTLATDTFHSVLQTGHGSPQTFRFIRADESSFYGEVGISVLHDKDGQPEGLLCITRDVSERIQAEETIRRLNRGLESRIVALTRPLDDIGSIRLEELFNLNDLQKIQDSFAEATGVASIITDPGGHPITNPSQFCRLCSEIVRCTETGKRNCQQSDIIIGHQNTQGPVILPCLSAGLWDGGTGIYAGDQHIGNWLVGQVLDDTCDLDALMEYAQEIGVDPDEYRKALEEVPRMPREKFAQICNALYRMADQLSRFALQNVQQARFIAESKQADNDRKNLEQQLAQSTKMESIGRLAGGVAHDFNNMLAIILGYSEFMLGELPEQHALRDCVSQILEAGRRSRDLTRQLLAFARKQTLEMRTLDLNQVVTGFEKMLRRTLKDDIRLCTMLCPSSCRFHGDVGQIEQVILNLVINAQDAMPNGGTLTLATERVALDANYTNQHREIVPGDYVELVVSDTGIGMTQETQEQIFDPFFTTKATGHGTGLGLSTVYGIVHQHNGYIDVQSEPGEGSCFRIYLPNNDNLMETIPTVAVPKVVHGGTETILLVEDQAHVRELTEHVLKRNGYKVLTAEDGEQALRVAGRYNGIIHLLVTDVVMPNINGRELYDRLIVQRPQLAVLYISGYPAEVVGQHGVLDDGMDYLPKPFELSVFSTRVREVLDCRVQK